VIFGYTAAQVAKAFIGALVGAAAILGPVLQSGGSPTETVWIQAAVAAVVGFAAVFSIPNAPATSKAAPAAVPPA
jgi:hypothetical protein